jgi:hypothetical protein
MVCLLDCKVTYDLFIFSQEGATFTRIAQTFFISLEVKEPFGGRVVGVTLFTVFTSIYKLLFGCHWQDSQSTLSIEHIFNSDSITSCSLVGATTATGRVFTWLADVFETLRR